MRTGKSDNVPFRTYHGQIHELTKGIASASIWRSNGSVKITFILRILQL